MITRLRETESRPVPSPGTKRARPPEMEKKHMPHISKRLHEFPLPALRWGGTRRAVRSGPGDHPGLAPRSCAVFPGRVPFDDVSHHPPFPALEMSSQADGTIDPVVGEIMELGKKPLDDFRSAVKMEYRLWEDTGAGGGNNMEKAGTTGPWNLRARRSRCRPPGECGDTTRLFPPAYTARETKISGKIGRPPFVYLPVGVLEFPPLTESGAGVGDEDEASAARPSNSPARKTSHNSSDDSFRKNSLSVTSMPAAAPTMTSTVGLLKPNRLRIRTAAVRESGSIRKFAIMLSRKEVEEDWLAITGTKLPRRPTKRPRHVQQRLNLCFPGSLLSEVTPEMYKVSDSHQR